MPGSRVTEGVFLRRLAYLGARFGPPRADARAGIRLVRAVQNFALGFAAKSAAPQVSLGTLFLAAQFIDLGLAPDGHTAALFPGTAAGPRAPPFRNASRFSSENPPFAFPAA